MEANAPLYRELLDRLAAGRMQQVDTELQTLAITQLRPAEAHVEVA